MAESSREDLDNPYEGNDVTMWVLRALADRRWNFSTVPGIARQTGLPEEQIKPIVTELLDREVARKPIVPDPQGRELFTLASRKPGKEERFTYFRTLLTKHL